jgi:hypothetical protein
LSLSSATSFLHDILCNFVKAGFDSIQIQHLSHRLQKETHAQGMWHANGRRSHQERLLLQLQQQGNFHNNCPEPKKMINIWEMWEQLEDKERENMYIEVNAMRLMMDADEDF